jgi:2-polyprenyl-3-methyl-5-hydroxy-6-metoxy-1,4-benzoquinol methylase
MRQWENIAEFLGFWLTGNPLVGEERREFETYYSSYCRSFGPYIRRHYADQTREVCRAIEKSSARNPRVLEVGCGCGTESLWFAILGGDVTAIDVTASRLKVAEARASWLRSQMSASLSVQFKQESFIEYEPEAPYDVIWLEQAFHHLEPRSKVYERLFDMLSEDGVLVICETNAWNVAAQIEMFRLRGFRTHRTFVDVQGGVHPYGDERIVAPMFLRKGLRNVGFESVEVRSYRLFPNWNVPELLWPMEAWVVRVLPFLSTHFNVVARKRFADTVPECETPQSV